MHYFFKLKFRQTFLWTKNQGYQAINKSIFIVDLQYILLTLPFELWESEPY